MPSSSIRLRRVRSGAARARRNACRPGMEAMEARRLLTLFTVSNTADGGAGSLRTAITQANASPGVDQIQFNIPGSGVHTIRPQSALPTITDPVVIDGYSQPGARPNTLAVGDNAVLLIELDGSAAGPGVSGLIVSASGSVVTGLVINRFFTTGAVSDRSYLVSSGILLLNSDGNTIAGNFIGTDPTGTKALSNVTGVRIDASSDNLIGGTTPEARNLLSGNVGDGVYLVAAQDEHGIYGDTTKNNQVQGNYIGTDASGTRSVGNSTLNGMNGPNPQIYGVFIGSGVANIIGGMAAGAGNVISGNSDIGVLISGPASIGNVVQGNLIGIDAKGLAPLPNTTGIQIVTADASTVGGEDSAAGNQIAYNRGNGILAEVSPVTILSNSIFANGGLGINFDEHYYVNMPPPILTSAVSGGTNTTIVGTLHSAPDTPFLIQFFANVDRDPSGAGEGQVYLGTTRAQTDGDGNARIDAVVPVVVPPGRFLTATAVLPAGTPVVPSSPSSIATWHLTSEFSQSLEVASAPPADLTASIVGPSGPVVEDQPLTYTFTVTNHGPNPATGMIVTSALPAGALLISATPSQGDVAQSNGQLTATLGTLPVGGSATIVVVVQPSANGTLSITAQAASEQSDPNPVDNAATLLVNVQATGPQVIDLRRFGYHALPTVLGLGFNRALNPATAQDRANYRLVSPGRDGRFGTRDDRPIAVRSAIYDPNAQTVALRPFQRLNLHRRYQITINGTTALGVIDLAGNLLDGDDNGRAGGDYAAIFRGFNGHPPAQFAPGGPTPFRRAVHGPSSRQITSRSAHTERRLTRVRPPRVHHQIHTVRPDRIG